MGTERPSNSDDESQGVTTSLGQHRIKKITGFRYYVLQLSKEQRGTMIATPITNVYRFEESRREVKQQTAETPEQLEQRLFIKMQ